eukprot:TRINITY_DN46889_c0_g1_i1.p1 TRINITY_DN46889_c0_g1~~TRINITY_DN46889_c0_g1_i1.p1  ORF type:complete len:245 (+),score=46.27 TRINITY_DN46889_c0_g1_i1:58-792(+)
MGRQFSFRNALQCGVVLLLVGVSYGRLQLSKKRMEVFMDTLCSDCQSWVVDELGPLWSDAEFKLALEAEYTIDFYASPIVSNTSTAQRLNSVVNCAARSHDSSEFVDFMTCWESSVSKVQGDKLLAKCSANPDGVNECLEDDEMLALISKTVASKMPAEMNWVPWVTVDGKHQEEAQTNLLKYFCSNLKAPQPGKCGSAASSHDKKAGGCGGTEPGGSPCLLVEGTGSRKVLSLRHIAEHKQLR